LLFEDMLSTALAAPETSIGATAKPATSAKVRNVCFLIGYTPM
jgi:hypothetical protein